MAYIDQFARVKRYLVRIESQNRDPTEYDDDLWSFFQNCWHLKDWVKNDSSLRPGLRHKFRGKELKKTLKECPSIKICADLANRTKHFELASNWFDAEVTQRNVTVNLGKRTHSTSEHIITLNDGTKKVALKVARDAVKEWKKFFKTHKLGA
jgi:hypothetical protein